MANQVEVARHLYMTKQALSQHIKDGHIPNAERGGFSLDECREAYIRHLREQAAGRLGKDATLSLTDERAGLAKAQREAQELKNAVTRGEYVSAADVTHRWADILRAVRSGILAVTSRIRHRLPHLTVDDAEVIEQEIRDALTALSNGDD